VDQVVQGSPEALGPKWLTGNRHRPFDLVWSGEDTLCGRTWRPPSLVEKLLNVGDIGVTIGAWQVPKWLAFVARQVVPLGETHMSSTRRLMARWLHTRLGR
jgi:hypothetical protein